MKKTIPDTSTQHPRTTPSLAHAPHFPFQAPSAAAAPPPAITSSLQRRQPPPHHHPHPALGRLYFRMDPADADALNISKCMLSIIIYSGDRDPEIRAGIIVECDLNSIFIIADGREFVGMNRIDDITVLFHCGDEFSPNGFCVENGLLGIYCTHPNGVFDMTTIEKIKICNQPLTMSQSVYVYEGLNQSLTPGNITRFFGHQFSHNCAAANMAEFGAPVINDNGEMVGLCLCCSYQYHLDAIMIPSLVETIDGLHSVLSKVGG